MIKIDLHVHACERSTCAHSTEEEQIEAARAAGLDGIAFTDHWRFMSPERLIVLNQKYAPFRIFNGVEMTVEREDFLVFGVRSLKLEQDGWAYPALHTFVHQQGGYLVLAHPFRFHDTLALPLEAYPPDGIEVHSVNTPSGAEKQIRSIASRYKIPLVCNSDAHHIMMLGQFYNLLEGPIEHEHDLFQTLKDGRYQCYAYNQEVLFA